MHATICKVFKLAIYSANGPVPQQVKFFSTCENEGYSALLQAREIELPPQRDLVGSVVFTITENVVVVPDKE
jgi:hypothetical protein